MTARTGLALFAVVLLVCTVSVPSFAATRQLHALTIVRLSGGPSPAVAVQLFDTVDECVDAAVDAYRPGLGVSCADVAVDTASVEDVTVFVPAGGDL